MYRIAYVDLYGSYRTGWLGPSGFVTSYTDARDVTVTSVSYITDLDIDLPMGTPPNAPTGVSATPYHQSALVSFTAPATTLTRPIIHYAVTASPGGRQCIAIATPSCTVTGLTDGTPYTFTVTASTIVGTSAPSSASAPVSPLPVPSAPGGVQATPAGSDVSVSWVAPADNGSAITGYLASVSPGGQACVPAIAIDTFCTIAAVLDGSHTVTVRATNAVGTGPAGSTAVLVDTAAPIVSAPSTSLRAGVSMSGTQIPVTVTWTASDALSGVADTTLALSYAGGAYVDQALSTGTAASLQRALGSSTSAYRFRDMAMDADGNMSGWATGPATYVKLRSQTGTGIWYHGSWATGSSTTATGGTYRYTGSHGAYVAFTFTGRGVAFIARKRSSGGKVSVYLDGVRVGTIDLYSASPTARWVAYTKMYPSSGRHVLKLVDQATSGRPKLYVDGFATIR